MRLKDWNIYCEESEKITMFITTVLKQIKRMTNMFINNVDNLMGNILLISDKTHLISKHWKIFTQCNWLVHIKREINSEISTIK